MNHQIRFQNFQYFNKFVNELNENKVNINNEIVVIVMSYLEYIDWNFEMIFTGFTEIKNYIQLFDDSFTLETVPLEYQSKVTA